MSAQFRPSDPHAPREIAVFDGTIRDPEALIAGLRPDITALRLSGAGDGLGEMLAALAGHAEIATLHLVCHGRPGALRLGDQIFSVAELRRRPSLLAALSARLAPGAVIRLYACRAGAGPEGRARFFELGFQHAVPLGAGVGRESLPVLRGGTVARHLVRLGVPEEKVSAAIWPVEARGGKAGKVALAVHLFPEAVEQGRVTPDDAGEGGGNGR